MVAPGVIINSSSVSPQGGPSLDTGQWFPVGITERGPIGSTLVRNLAEFVAIYGDRVSYQTLWDSLDAYFRVGGRRAWVTRVVGPNPLSATLTLKDGGPSTGTNTLAVSMKDPGDWANGSTVQVIVGSVVNSFVIVIARAGVELERSPDLLTPTDAVSWGVNYSRWVNVADLASAVAAPGNNPRVLAATAMASGTDDRLNITDAQWLAAGTRIPYETGPGQISYPGQTTAAKIKQQAALAAANNRNAFVDLPNVSDANSLITLVNSIRADVTVDEAYVSAYNWLTIPGIVSGVLRTVPGSAIAAGLVAAQDFATKNANSPAAGENGKVSYAIDVAQVWDDATRGLLNNAGINLFRRIYGVVELFGYRTLDLTVWVALNNQRLRCQILNQAQVYALKFVFQQIDGQGHKIAEFRGGLLGMLQDYYTKGALFGATPDDAFDVDTGETQNTPTTLANRELRALLKVRMSPFAEFVSINLVRYDITEAIAA